MLRDAAEFDGKKYSIEWFAGAPLPSGERATQVSGVCFTHSGEIVLVSGDGAIWGLPGGHPETGESPEDALRREVREEARCEVERAEYLGYQKCIPEGGGKPDFQLRFWCAVTVGDFQPRHEIGYRKLVSADDFLKTLSWGASPIAKDLARLAGECMNRYLM